MSKHHFLGLFLCILLSTQVVGQELYRSKLDELKKQPASAKRDSAIVHYLFSLSKLRNPGIAWNDSLRRFSIDHKSTIGYMLWELKDIERQITNLNYGQGIKRILAIADNLEKSDHKSYAAFAYLRAGIIYVYSTDDFLDRRNAIPYYTKAIQLASESKDRTEMLRANDYMGELYFEMNDFEKAIAYLKKAEELIKKNDDKYMYPSIAASLSASYFQLGQQSPSDFYHKKTIYWLEKSKLKFDERYHVYINYIYQKGVASRYLQLKQYNEAAIHAKQALTSIKEQIVGRKVKIGKFENYSINLLRILYLANHKQKNYKEAFLYLEELYEKQNIHQKNELNDLFQELNVKYQTDQNKLKITALQNENLKKDAEKQITFMYFSSAAVFLLLLVTALTLYSNIVLRRKNKEIAEAQLKGQTLERQRVAADLHDNLGTTLSALRWNLEAMNTAKLTSVEQAVYATINQQVGQAYNDVRLLSHNLLPNELAKQGLAVALKILVDKMNRNTPVHFRLSGADALPRLDTQTEFELYSICLELLNNIIKHAQATEGFIDLALTSGTLHLTVGDNGMGLATQRTDGRGLQNVAARVEALGGTWQVEAGQGVAHRISVPVRLPAHASWRT